MRVTSLAIARRIAGALALLCAASIAHAQLTVEINRGQENAVPIAIVPFGWSSGGSPPFDLAQIVADDLQRSGRFKPLERKDMADADVGQPTREAEIRFNNWRLLSTDYIVVGRLVPQGADRFLAEYDLFNVLTGKPVAVNGSVAGSARTSRAMAHYIADDLYEKLTGVRGVFSTRIAYVSVEGTPPQLTYKMFIADADGENRQEIRSVSEPLMSPAWSPDGQSLAYVSFESKASAIYVHTVATGERRRVSARAGINGAPAWSPDGSTLALTLSRKDGDVDVYTLKLATQTLTRMTFDPGIDTEPQWSADGRKLYFVSDRAGGPQVYEIDVDTPNRATRVTFEGTYNARPRLSPDGKQLALVTLDRGNYRIGLYDMNSKGLRVLTQGRQDESPSFAPNGAMLIYATQERGRGVLATVTTDGRETSRLAETKGDVREPVWAPFRPRSAATAAAN